MAQLNPTEPIVSPSATATNGSDIVTVTGGKDCSFVRKGTIVFITGRQPVLAISGTPPNGSGVSTIKLKAAWSYPSTTGELMAINTYEGLANAIYELSVLIDELEANKNKRFEYKGSYDLAAAVAASGGLPPAPANGSALYRISTQATFSGKLYRVNEPIYYDNLTSQWRSMWDGFGTAAFANVQTSATDASTPNALMRRGDWGIGEGADSAVTTIDFNALANTQFVQVQNISTNGPTNYNGTAASLNSAMALHLQWGSAQIAYQVNWTGDGRRFERQKIGGVWDTQWRDMTAGVGVATTQDVNCDTITYGGLYRAVAGTRPNSNNQHLLHINRAANAQAAQIMIEDNSGGGLSWRNRIGDGSWTASKFAYHRGNILGAVSQSAGIPTGAIIQRGANANGSFVLFADGSAINYPNPISIAAHAINVDTTSSRSWPFAFSSLASVQYSPRTTVGASGNATAIGLLIYNGVYTAASSVATATLSTFSYRAAVPNEVSFNVVGFGFWF